MNIILELNNKPIKPWIRFSWKKKAFGISCGIIGFFIVNGDVIELAAKYKKLLKNAESREKELRNIIYDIRCKRVPMGDMCDYCGVSASNSHSPLYKIDNLPEEAPDAKESA